VREGTEGRKREGNGEEGKRGKEGGEKRGRGRDIPVPDWENEKVATLMPGRCGVSGCQLSHAHRCQDDRIRSN